METGHLLECRGCGRRQPIHLAAHQVELAQVGMLEVHCFGCGKIARFQLVAARRATDRRVTDRRNVERRSMQLMPAPLLGRERRGGRERRTGPIRKTERRSSAVAAS